MRAIVWVALVATLVGCASSAKHEEGSDTSSAATTDSAGADLVPAVNAFACDLYRELAAKPGNLVFSPFSVSAVMGSIYAGAAGQTRAEMQKALHLPAGDARVYESYRTLFATLDAHAARGGAQWTLANRAWVQNGFQLRPEYVATVRDDFGFDVGTADFRGSPDAARTAINQWVEEKTRQRIKDLFPPGSIDGDMRLVLANAIYFKGLWDRQFDKKATRPARFHTGKTTTREVPTMSLSEHFAIADVGGARALELPYKEKQLSMVLVLPDDIDGLAALEKRLSADTLSAWVSNLREREVEVALPRFTATQEFKLTKTLAGMGMPSAFDAQAADFSGMTGGRDLYVGIVVHKAFVDVNEEGTEAAAATGGGMRATSAQIPVEFKADHPFLFLIRDRASGCVLFLGRVANPGA